MPAKTPGLSTNIKLDGEAEYRQKLKDIGAGLRVLDSEMDKTKAAFDGQAASVDSLSAQQDVLSRKLSTQHERVEVLREALQKAAQAYGESDSRTMKWQTDLNKAEAEELRLQHQLDRTSEAMRQQSKDVQELGDETDASAKKTTGLGDAIGGAASKLGINLPQGATNALNSLSSLDAGTAVALGGFAALAAGIAKVEKALIDVTKENAAAADELATLSVKTGLSTQTLQELQYAAEFVDTDVETVTGSLTKLTRSMDSAREGTGSAAEAFGRLGINVTDANGNLRSAEDVFFEAVDALGRMQNATERDAVAMDLMGKSAQDLNPLIAAGSDGLKKLARQADDTGYVLDDFALQKLTAVDDAFQTLEKSRETFTKNVSAEFAPSVQNALSTMANLIDKVGDALTRSGIVKAFGSILDSVTSMIDPVGDLTGALTPLKIALDSIAFLCAWIADTFNAIRGLLPSNWGSGLLKSSLGLDSYNPSNIQRWSTGVSTGASWDASRGWVDAYGNAWGGVYHAAGTDSFAGGLTWVGENGPELVSLPRGSAITSASESRELGGDTYYITIDAKSVKEFNDIVRIAKNARMNLRKAVTA